MFELLLVLQIFLGILTALSIFPILTFVCVCSLHPDGRVLNV